MFDIERFRTWLYETLSKDNARSVIRTFMNLHAGKSVAIAGCVYEPLVGVCLTPDMVTIEMCDAARNWAPRGKKSDVDSKFVDCSKGWSLHHPLRRMLKYKTEVMIPQRELHDATQLARVKLQTMHRLDKTRVNAHRKRKAWAVESHTAHNTEQSTSTAPFLKECLAHSLKHGYEWRYIDEFPFGNRQRCDLFMSCDECDIVVESKTKNLLHGIGQVLHYNELAIRDVPNYSTRRHLMLVALACAPRPLELKTAEKFGVHVWWPDGPPLPDFGHVSPD